MNHQTDLRALWRGLDAGPVPPAAEVQAQARKVLQREKRRLLLTNAGLVATFAFIAGLCTQLEVHMVSTRIGIGLILLSIAVYLVMYNRLLAGLFRPVPELDSKGYLDRLIAAQQQQRVLQRSGLSVYYISLSLGIVLYMVEFVLRMPLWMAILSYGLTLGWIGVSWFVLRPRSIRKQMAVFDEAIGHLQQIREQAEDEL